MAKYNLKDYTNYIGNVFSELTILSIGDPIGGNKRTRMCVCECSCGETVERNFFQVRNGKIKSCGHLRSQNAKSHLAKVDHKKGGETHNKSGKPSSNNTLGIKNVYWVESEKLYVVSIKRNGKLLRRRSKTLAGALEAKKQLLETLSSNT